MYVVDESERREGRVGEEETAAERLGRAQIAPIEFQSVMSSFCKLFHSYL